MSDRDTLDHVSTFAVHAVEVRVAPLPWPRSDLPWGATAALTDAAGAALKPPPRPPTGVAAVRPKRRPQPEAANSGGMDGGAEPVYTIVGDRRASVALRTSSPLLSVCHIYDSEGHELVTDRDNDMKYTVVLNRRALQHAGDDIDEHSEEVKGGTRFYYGANKLH